MSSMTNGPRVDVSLGPSTSRKQCIKCESCDWYKGVHTKGKVTGTFVFCGGCGWLGSKRWRTKA